MEKIGINLVGVGSIRDDHSTRLYNIGGGFRGITGKIVSRVADSIYLSITSDRAYAVAVEGDLVVCDDATESVSEAIKGITAFDVNWTAAAQARGNGNGKITLTNPDAPNQVSTFEVVMGKAPSVAVVFAANTGDNARIALGNADVSVIDPAMKALLSASAEDNPYTVGMAFYNAVWPAMGDNAYEALLNTDVVYGDERRNVMLGSARPDDQFSVGDHHLPNFGSIDWRQEVDRIVAHECPHRGGSSDHFPHLSAIVIAGDFNLGRTDHNPFASHEIAPLLLSPLGVESLGDPTYHRLEDLLVRPGIEDLLASIREDAGIKVETQVRDFSQLARTRSNDLERIEQAVAAASALGIDTSNIASKRDAALAKLSVFADRFESGGEQTVTEAEGAVIMEVFGQLWGIHEELNKCVSHWHHYKQHEANHDSWVARLADRKRDFKLADGHADNRIGASYIPYAADPSEALEKSKAAFVELFAAIQRGDLAAAHKADVTARHFSTREHMLNALIRRGVLVETETPAAAA